jgi:hypothetical protein
MIKKFTLLLIGPAGSGKSTFVAGLSKIDILKYVAAESNGGANTTKVSTTYEFSHHYNSFQVSDCVCEQPENQEKMLNELKDLCIKKDGIQQIFNKINDSEFAKKCNSVTIQLPCKDGLLPDDCIYDSIIIRDNRGLGDIDNSVDIKIDDLGITYDVNAILFFSISQIQQPAIFTKIIDSVLQVNLKTPIFSLRRYSKLTKNDKEFEAKILDNIRSSDEELYDCIINLGEEEKNYRINNFVFNLPEVEQWAGVVDYDEKTQSIQIEEYTKAMGEFLSYSILMYEKLHDKIVDKMSGQYQEKFVNIILNQLKTKTAFDIAASITEFPHSKPGKGYDMNRDTIALTKPADLSSKLVEQPFRSERSAAGNRYQRGIIPSYSYSCVNFRNIFYSIVNCLTKKESSLIPLFCTFIDITLEKYTTTASTGYQQQIRIQNAFKFDIFLSVREACTEILKRNKLVEDDNNVWKNFSLKKYEYDKAIAVFIYSTLIDFLRIMDNKPSTNETSKQFIETYKSDEIFKLMKRS